MVRGLLVWSSVLALVAGCLADPAAEPSPGSGATPTPSPTPSPTPRGGDPWFVLVEETFFVNSTSSQRMEGRFGPHCENVRYVRSPPSLELLQERTVPVASGIVVRDYDETSMRSRSVSHISSGIERVEFDAEGGEARLLSPFDPETVVLTLATDGDAIVVDGERVPVGATAVSRAEYPITKGDATYQVVEIFEVSNLGPAPAVVTEPQGLCD